MVNWFLTPAPRASATRRVYCVPYAGAGAAAYRDWGRLLPDWLELCALQLPGRGWRLAERPSTDLEGMATAIAEAIADHQDRPFVLFGHSMGAWLAFLATRQLQVTGHAPEALVVSGRQAPRIGPIHPPMSHLDDADFVTEVQSRYGGIPREIREDAEILALLLPALRADVEGLERYEHRDGPPIPCPLVAVGGDRDPLVPLDYLDPWEEEAGAGFRREALPGDHFYFRDDPRPLLELIVGEFGATAGVGAEGGRR